MFIANNWKDYEVIDTSGGEKLERWGKYLLVRPDPQVIWNTPKNHKGWKKMNGHYHRSNKGGGQWEFFDLPEQWAIHYGNLTFNLKPFSFKHTGLFPEQAANWDFIYESLKGKNAKVLNLFAYTGAASMVALSAGAEVVHVDASKSINEWAKENRDLNKFQDRKIRFIVDDCLKFMQREKRRGNSYDAIIMDPPSYGRGPNNELFKFEEKINPLIEAAIDILSDKPVFLIINTYTTGYSASVIKQVLGANLEKTAYKFDIVSDEIGIHIEDSDYDLPCGFTTRGIFHD